MLVDGVRIRTIYRLHYILCVRITFAVMMSVKIAILSLESRQKRRYTACGATKDQAPEEFSGLFSHAFILWMNPLIKKGYTGILQNSDLHPIDHNLSSHSSGMEIWEAWKHGLSPHFGIRQVLFSQKLTLLIAIKKNRNTLMWVSMKYLRSSMLMPIAPRLLLIACKFSQPLLLNLFLRYLEQPDSPESHTTGQGLIAAFAAAYLASAVSGNPHA